MNEPIIAVNKNNSKKFISNIMNFNTDIQNKADLYELSIIEYLDSIIVSIDDLNFENKKPLFKKKIKFNNFDERLNIFYGFKYDFDELIIEENDKMIIIEKQEFDVVGFIENKLTLLRWKEFDKSVLSTNSVEISKYLTSSEVIDKLRISDQTLANWRKKGLLEFKKISQRKFLYDNKVIDDIFKHGISDENDISVIVKKSDNKNDNKKCYEKEIIEMLKPLIFKVEEYKFNHQNYFFNFGNVGITSSPQVMINNNCQLVDYIKKDIIFDNSKDLYEYMRAIFSDGKEPRIDTSKKIPTEFSRFYLNRLKTN